MQRYKLFLIVNIIIYTFSSVILITKWLSIHYILQHFKDLIVCWFPIRLSALIPRKYSSNFALQAEYFPFLFSTCPIIFRLRECFTVISGFHMSERVNITTILNRPRNPKSLFESIFAIAVCDTTSSSFQSTNLGLMSDGEEIPQRMPCGPVIFKGIGVRCVIGQFVHCPV